MSSEQEKAEKESSDIRLKSLQGELDEAKEELERLQNDRRRQVELVEGIVRQRDMYKVLLSQEQVSSLNWTKGDDLLSDK